MEPDDYENLRRLIVLGQPIQELWVLRKACKSKTLGLEETEDLSDLWQLILHHPGAFPIIEAAKAIVDLTVQSDNSYPILTNDGIIYDGLSPEERRELAQYTRNRMVEENPSVVRRALEQFIADLQGTGP